MENKFNLFMLILFFSTLIYLTIFPHLFIKTTEFKIRYNQIDKFYDTTIYYDRLEENEVKEIQRILTEIDPIYIKNSKKIIFTKDYSNYDKNCPDCIGINFDKGELIVILYTRDKNYLKNTVLHELCHSFINSKDEEEIADKLADQLSGFKVRRE